MYKKLIVEFCTWLDNEGYVLCEREEYHELHREVAVDGILSKVDDLYLTELINRFVVSELPYVS